MTSRLILNLTCTARARQNIDFLSQTGADQPVFGEAKESFLGNIGAPLRSAEAVDENDEETSEFDNIPDEESAGLGNSNR